MMKTTKRIHAGPVLAILVTVAASEALARLPAPPPEDSAAIVQAWLDSARQVESFDAQILRRCPGPVLSRSATAVLRFEATVYPELDQRIDAFPDGQIDAAAVAAVTAIRPSARNVLFAPFI